MHAEYHITSLTSIYIEYGHQVQTDAEDRVTLKWTESYDIGMGKEYYYKMPFLT